MPRAEKAENGRKTIKKQASKQGLSKQSKEEINHHMKSFFADTLLEWDLKASLSLKPGSHEDGSEWPGHGLLPEALSQ
ncbi:MAG: hypothetical protein PWQ50_820 [Methanolobus sp.]|nr:hypothetical protein [Methanolobus sp.]